MAMETIAKNTIFTNVAETSDGGVFWEGLEGELPRSVKIKSWLGVEDWHPEQGKPSAHPNSRSVHGSSPGHCLVLASVLCVSEQLFKTLLTLILRIFNRDSCLRLSFANFIQAVTGTAVKSNTNFGFSSYRFCTPAEQCPIMDEKWQDPEGVPIEAIIFGGRRPDGS